MPTVYHCSPTNSTYFTTCCRVAILANERNCPRCKEEVTPHGDRARWSVAHGPEREARRLAIAKATPQSKSEPA